MKCLMTIALTACLGSLASSNAGAQDKLHITSFERDGSLTFAPLTNSRAAEYCYQIEWASSPNGPWTNSWDHLTHLYGTGGVFSVRVPLYYRVQATDTNYLVAYYPLDGDATDASGRGLDGQVYGASPAVGRYGAANTAYSFDGANDCIVVPHMSPFDIKDQITLSAWVKPRADDGSDNPILSKSDGPNGYQQAYKLSFTQGWFQPYFTLRMNGSNAFATGSVTVSLHSNQWNHLAGTYDGATIRLYLNGLLIDSHPATGSIETNGAPLNIGSVDGGSDKARMLNGTIDDVRIYRRGLSANEVLELYSEP